MTIRRRHLPVMIAVIVFVVLCVGVTGIYTGSTLAKSAWEKDKLSYEQRLGTQSAEYAKNLQTFQDDLIPIASALRQTQKDLHDLTEKFDKATVKRDRANNAAIQAAQEASSKADALSDQLRSQQRVIVAKTDEAVSAAKATEKKLDTATLPAAAVPAHPWGK
jgi:chromosome segregation ATPase